MVRLFTVLFAGIAACLIFTKCSTTARPAVTDPTTLVGRFTIEHSTPDVFERLGLWVGNEYGMPLTVWNHTDDAFLVSSMTDLGVTRHHCFNHDGSRRWVADNYFEEPSPRAFDRAKLSIVKSKDSTIVDASRIDTTTGKVKSTFRLLGHQSVGTEARRYSLLGRYHLVLELEAPSASPSTAARGASRQRNGKAWLYDADLNVIESAARISLPIADNVGGATFNTPVLFGDGRLYVVAPVADKGARRNVAYVYGVDVKGQNTVDSVVSNWSNLQSGGKPLFDPAKCTVDCIQNYVSDKEMLVRFVYKVDKELLYVDSYRYFLDSRSVRRLPGLTLGDDAAAHVGISGDIERNVFPQPVPGDVEVLELSKVNAKATASASSRAASRSTLGTPDYGKSTSGLGAIGTPEIDMMTYEIQPTLFATYPAVDAQPWLQKVHRSLDASHSNAIKTTKRGAAEVAYAVVNDELLAFAWGAEGGGGVFASTYDLKTGKHKATKRIMALGEEWADYIGSITVNTTRGVVCIPVAMGVEGKKEVDFYVIRF